MQLQYQHESCQTTEPRHLFPKHVKHVYRDIKPASIIYQRERRNSMIMIQ